MDIIASILSVTDEGSKKTHIMYRCNLSFKQLHVYLAFLEDRQLLKPVRISSEDGNNSVVYETTRKGRAFLQAYSSIRSLLSDNEF